MISVILYGRNDDYGYNLHKRASLSLNCIAHVLSDADDEIIFVDYNTPDDFPTFPEAIRDTLTSKTQRLLRILRVRPEVHQRYQRYTHLPALEPVARNVGIRRTNQNNRWILSTNTDMILVPTANFSLSVIASELPSGFYHVPRYDVPESLWETFNRMDPDDVIGAVQELGETAHLNEIIFGADHMLYDAPGDFQLMERNEIFAINGFCEAMLVGWHVDANISKRLSLRHGCVGDLADRVRAYHCEHTRSFSTMHYVSKSNDIARFVDEVTVATIPEQADSWGCPHDDIEEIRLPSCPSSVYLEALHKVIGAPQRDSPEVSYTPETFNLVNYDSKHVLPFLTDVFVNLPRKWSIGWLGDRSEMLDLFCGTLKYLGYRTRIILDKEISPSAPHSHHSIELRAWHDLVHADAFVFDFADLECARGIEGLKDKAAAQASALISRFFSLLSIERRRCVEGFERRRVILINAINNDFEKLSQEFLQTVRTPLTSRVRHGFVSPPQEAKWNWLDRQLVGMAGLRQRGEVHILRGQPGHVIYGPFVTLLPGRYRATVAIRIEEATEIACRKEVSPLVIEVVSKENFLAQREIPWRELKQDEHILDFEVTSEMANCGASLRTELRVWTSGHLSAFITTVELEAIEHPLSLGLESGSELLLGRLEKLS